MRALQSYADASFQSYTKESSTVQRGLALAAIAIVWLYAGGLTADKGFDHIIRSVLTVPLVVGTLIASVLFLFFDVLQYAISSLILAGYRNALSKTLGSDDFTSNLAGRARDGWESYFGKKLAWRITREGHGLADVDNSEKQPASNTEAIARARQVLAKSSVARDSVAAARVEAFLDSQLLPSELTRTSFGMFCAKSLCLVAAYGMLLAQIVRIVLAA